MIDAMPGPTPDSVLRTLVTADLAPREVADIRELMDAAFGDDEAERFTDEDWQHAVGGFHFVVDIDGVIAAHASVVPRMLHLGGRPVRAGYVEAVATRPELQGQGLGSRLMGAVNEWIRGEYELGALGTGRHTFYERLGWLTWRGSSFVRTATGEVPTPEDDGYILVLPTPASPELDLDEPIGCEWRRGDVW